MKKFTIISSILFISLLIGMLFYVNASKDFKEPQVAKPAGSQNNDENSPIYQLGMEDLKKYLGESGLVDISKPVLLATSGLCSDAFNLGGVEVYWWDVKKMDKKSDEYKCFKSLKDNGTIDLFNSGSIISPVRNGPFAINPINYSGNIEELTKVFLKFGGE